MTLQNQVNGQYDMVYSGLLNAEATQMSGDIAVAGVTGTFSGTKDK